VSDYKMSGAQVAERILPRQQRRRYARRMPSSDQMLRRDAAADRAQGGNRLKRVLRTLDLCSLAVGWWLSYMVLASVGAAKPWDRVPLLALGLTGIVTSLIVMASKRLWLARVCAVRSTELEGLGQTAVFSALIVLAVGQLIDYDSPDRFALLGAINSFVLLTATRSVFAAVLRRARRRGRLTRGLVLVGLNAQARHLTQLIRRHPGSGYDIVGVCGPRRAVEAMDLGVPWLGEHERAAEAVADVGASGALVVASALDPLQLNGTLRQLLRNGCHVHLFSGLQGISPERLLPQPIAREPLFYLEQTSLTRSQRMLKRALDTTVAVALFALVLPVLVAAALAIKLDDGGPIVFRQRRVGRDGKPFTLLKLRTMVPNAEAYRADLEHQNHRTGPLFKMVGDPRITRVGHFLRATSIDELPQLINIIRGDMSLVGPRPALPDEVAQFDVEHQERGTMMPGITGLWQVEGRDDPSFDSYRRLDLYYVENWSIGLDLAILLATAGVVASRGVRSLTTSGDAA
jgi:exopolysaccharide biosynthesis polyprenyl glycosylphosphotransferase